MPCCCEFHKGTGNQIALSQTNIVLTNRIAGFATTEVVVTEDIGDRRTQCSSLGQGLHLGWHTGQRRMQQDGRTDLSGSGQGKKNTTAASSFPYQRAAGRPSMDPRAGSLVRQRQVQPGMLNVKFHRQPWEW